MSSPAPITNPQTIGYVAGTPVVVDMHKMQSPANLVRKNVLLSASYTPDVRPGMPHRPMIGGVHRHAGALSSGSTQTFHGFEADAIVAAGGGTLA